MHAIRPPVITRVSVRDDVCHLGLTFPDDTDATRFGHDAAALLDQGVDVDLARSADPAIPDAWPGSNGGNGHNGNGANGGNGAGTPSKSEMLARGIRHDLQGPLTVVRSYLELMLEEAEDDMPAASRTYLEEAAQGAERLQAMIEGIGNLDARSEVGRRRPVDLDEVLDDALRNLGLRLQDPRVTLERGPLPDLAGDAGSLARVLQNLLGNVVDHVPGDVTVRVDAVEEPDGWRVRVADDGPGIPEEEQEWVFDPLRRGSGAEGPSGGVGLAVCRRIVQAHGGEIGLESAPGEGATIWFTLPQDGLQEG